jgi:8-oxo-dGTP pyrophosphatase MutT (NUDIX family)
LQKLAAFVVNQDKSLPYRRRVEVVIWKDGKVLITKNKNKEGEEWYGFPGGGTEGDTDENAARNECLEEVGIAVDGLKKTSVLHRTEGISDKKGRGEKYRGSLTRVFSASFLGLDKSRLGADGDSVKYVWKTPDEAATLLKDNKVDSSYRLRALRESTPQS